MTSFDLRELIRDEIASSAVADPAVIAEHVAKRVPTAHVRAALALALHDMVRVAVVKQRYETHRAVERAAVGRGSKWDDAGEMYRAILGQRIEVGGEDREWKFLGDCTRDDLLQAVSTREEQAKGLIMASRRYKAIADLLERHAKDQVSELPLDEVAAVFA